jgi:hypothetical protein
MLLTTDAGQIFPSEAKGLAEVSPHHPSPARVLDVDDESAACELLTLILSPPALHGTTAYRVTLQRGDSMRSFPISRCPESVVWKLRASPKKLGRRFARRPEINGWTRT